MDRDRLGAALKELSDEEVFGSKELSDAEVFGAPASPESKVREGLVGGTEAIASLGSGALAAPIAGLAGVASLAVPGVNSGDVVGKVQNALTYEPRTEMGRKGVEQVSAPFKWLADKADQAGGAVSDASGSPMLGAAVNTAIQAAPMILGKVISKAGASPQAVAARAKAMKLGAPTQAGLDAADTAGLAVTPTEAGAGVAGRTVESVVGSPRLQKLTSQKNAPVINEIIRKDVGLADDVPLTRESLTDVRKNAGKVYSEIRGLGRIDTDVKFADDLQQLVKTQEGAERSFPTGRKDPLYSIIEQLNRPSFLADAAIDKINLLRADADAAYRARDFRLGKAYKDASIAIEDQIDRHLAREVSRPGTENVGAGGMKRLPSPTLKIGGTVEKDITPTPSAPETPRVTSDLLNRFRGARKIIAKTYAADAALNEATGNINAAKYAQMLKNKKPLDQGALQVAKFGQQFPKSTQVAERVGPTGPTIHDLALGGLGQLSFGAAGYAAAGAHGLPLAALAVARPVGRSVLASRPYQKLQRKMNRPTGKQGLSRHAGRAGTLASLAEQHEPKPPAHP